MMDINYFREHLSKNYEEFGVNRKDSLREFLNTFSPDYRYGFAVYDKNIQNCCFGLNSDVNVLLADVLQRINCQDIEAMFRGYSEIYQGEWYDFVLKIDIEELRSRKK